MTTEIRGFSTRGFYERSTRAIGELRAGAEKLQVQISTGNRLARSSDDPLAAAQLRMLARAESFSGVDKSNADRARTDLTLADEALGSFADLITRAQELATQAGNGTLDAAQRASIGKELSELHQQMVGLANSRDSGGDALFGGDSPGNAYTLDASGNAVYTGTTSSGELSLGDGQSVTRGITGPEFLKFGPAGAQTDLLATVKGLADALQSGTGDPAGAARAALDPLSSGLQSVSTAQTVIGSRLAWVDLATERNESLGELRAEEQTEIGGTDMAATVARLQETMVVLEASQASFARLTRLSLLDALR